MTRKTIKYRAALVLAQIMRLPCARQFKCPPNDVLYRELTQQGYTWDARAGIFRKREVSKSVFLDPNGGESGEWRIRIRAAPDTARRIEALICDLLPKRGYPVRSTSAQEPDASGASVRVYLQGNLIAKKGKKS